MSTPLRVLQLQLDYPRYHDACRYSYSHVFGITDGFREAGADVVSLPVLHGESPSCSWLCRAREWFRPGSFDLVWFEIEHSRYDDETLEWLSAVAPVRVGLVSESMTFHPHEHLNNPKGVASRLMSREKNHPVTTHFVCVDERDVSDLKAQGRKALWCSGSKMPRRFIGDDHELPSDNFAVFWGTPYGPRKAWIEHPLLKDLMLVPTRSPELDTEIPALYENLHKAMALKMEAGEQLTQSDLSQFQSLRRTVRQLSFKTWLQVLRIGCAQVNLPQFSSVYAGRVIESMAAGRPVLSFRIAGRPLTNSLFQDGESILLFDTPEELAQLISKVSSDKPYGMKLAAKAREKLLAFHTSEGFIGDLMRWLISGKEPAFY